MKVGELISRLQAMPPDASVGYVWDGEVRSDVDHVWLARSGEVVLAYYEATVYSEESRPPDAPNQKADPYWEAAPNPKDVD